MLRVGSSLPHHVIERDIEDRHVSYAQHGGASYLPHGTANVRKPGGGPKRLPISVETWPFLRDLLVGRGVFTTEIAQKVRTEDGGHIVQYDDGGSTDQC